MKEKLVTIMTPCYNGEKYIKNLIAVFGAG